MDDVNILLESAPLDVLYNILYHMDCNELLTAYVENPRVREALYSYSRIRHVLKTPLAVVLINNLERAKLGLKLDMDCNISKSDPDYVQLDDIVARIREDMQNSYNTVDEAFKAFQYRNVIVTLFDEFREEFEEYMFSSELNKDLQDIILFLIEKNAPLERLKTDMPTAEDVPEKFEHFVAKVYQMLFEQLNQYSLGSERSEVQQKINWFRDWTSELDHAGFDSKRMFKIAKRRQRDHQIVRAYYESYRVPQHLT